MAANQGKAQEEGRASRPRASRSRWRSPRAATTTTVAVAVARSRLARSTLQLAHSYTETQPQHRCGAQVIADEVADADVGVTVEIFPASQLGADADRIASVVSGDIDMDIQGASALGAVYEPVQRAGRGVRLRRQRPPGPLLRQRRLRPTCSRASRTRPACTRSAPGRPACAQFTANEPIREPGDLDGLRMRFPNSPQFLMNAEALGADATEVAYEELFLALQQGTVDGQENPITNIAASSLQDVQDYISMSTHQANSQPGDHRRRRVERASPPSSRTRCTRPSTRPRSRCPAASPRTRRRPSPSGRSPARMEVVDDVDVEAFRTQADAYLRENFNADQLAVYEAIRGEAE